MKSLQQDAWDGVCGALARLAGIAQQAGATKAVFRLDTETAVLDVAFDGTAKSPLFIDIHRPSATFCAAFGRAVEVSDYPAELDWLLALAEAVTKGGWREECVLFGERVYSSRAEISIMGQADWFYGTYLWALRLRRPERASVVYAPWVDDEIDHGLDR